MRCSIQNLSAGGALLRTEKRLPAGTDVVLYLLRTGVDAVLKLTGTVLGEKTGRELDVARTRVPVARVQFDPMPDDQFALLRDVLRSLGAPEGTMAPGAVSRVSKRSLSVEILVEAPQESFKPPTIPPVVPIHASTGPQTASESIEQLKLENQRLKIQIQGLLMELGEAQVDVVRKNEQIEELSSALLLARGAAPRKK